MADSAFVTTKAAQGKTGTWLIDPNDFTVAASGGDMTGAAVATALATTNFTIETATMGTAGGHGDIHVNDAITWDSDTRLTLDAERDIHINDTITANGAAAGLTLNTGGDYHIRTKASYAGAVLDANGKPVAQQDTSGGVYGSVTFNNSANADGLTINGDTYTLIHSMAQLDALDGRNAVDGTGTAVAVTGNYALAKDLDASGATYTQALLGTSTALPFGGTLTGLGHTINHLTISAPTTATAYTGLIGVGRNVVLRDIGIIDAHITGTATSQGATGTLVGQATNGIIHNAYSTGKVSSAGSGDGPFGVNLGGLAGALLLGTLSSSYSNASLYGNSGGGLIGRVVNAEISHAHATGDVSVTSSNGTGGTSGGLIGYGSTFNVSDAYATGEVSGSSLSTNLGGLIGKLSLDVYESPSLSITNSFASGNVTGGTFLGGLVGQIDRSGNNQTGQMTINNAYATGNVTGGFSNTILTGDGVGGLIGAIRMNSSSDSVNISNAHTTGTITLSENQGGTGYVGGLVGLLRARSASITNSSRSGDINAPSARFVGGLVGQLVSPATTISGTYVSGNIIGRSEVGGLVGSLQGYGAGPQSGTITSSYFDGRVAASGGDVGGLFGAVEYANIGPDVFYNQDGASSAIGSAAAYGELTNNSQGLTSAQFSDIAHYLDGTIDQVLAGRAAQAARDQAARDQALADRATLAANLGGNQIAAAQQQGADPVQGDLPGLPHAGQIAPPPAVANHIAFADDVRYSSNIQSIEINGGTAEQDEDASQNRQ